MKLTTTEAVIATFAIGIMIFALRVLPFVIFGKRKTPAFFGFIEKFVPAISIAVLFVACFKEKTTDLIFKNGADLSQASGLIATLIAAAATVVLHLWKKNAMISIFGGTILYMILNYIF